MPKYSGGFCHFGIQFYNEKRQKISSISQHKYVLTTEISHIFFKYFESCLLKGSKVDRSDRSGDWNVTLMER